MSCIYPVLLDLSHWIPPYKKPKMTLSARHVLDAQNRTVVAIVCLESTAWQTERCKKVAPQLCTTRWNSIILAILSHTAEKMGKLHKIEVKTSTLEFPYIKPIKILPRPNHSVHCIGTGWAGGLAAARRRLQLAQGRGRDNLQVQNACLCFNRNITY